MSELVTDAMVEAALEGSYAPPKEPGYTFLNRDTYRDLWSHHMRAALEAAAPAIAAKAWEEGYQACRNRPRVDGYLINRANPYQTRADHIERGES